MNIVLIGMRGSGKSTIGGILARKLGRELIEMDILIARHAGMSIPEIVERHGWKRFRDLEEEIIPEVSSRENVIISAGGGVVTRNNNITGLKTNGVVVWLTAGTETLLARIGDDPGRPPFVNGRTRYKDMETTLTERRALYDKAADVVIDTEDKTSEEVAKVIIDHLRHQGAIQ